MCCAPSEQKSVKDNNSYKHFFRTSLYLDSSPPRQGNETKKMRKRNKMLVNSDVETFEIKIQVRVIRRTLNPSYSRETIKTSRPVYFKKLYQNKNFSGSTKKRENKNLS